MGFFGAIKRIGEKVAGGVSRVGSVVSGVANEVAKVGAKVAPVLEAGLTAVGAPELAAGVAGGLKEVGKVAGEVSKVAGGVNKQLQAGNIVGAVKSGLAGARSIRGGIGSGTTAGAGGLTTNRGMGVGAGGKGGLGVSPSALGTNALPSTQTATTQLGRMASGTRSTNAKAIETDVMNYVHRLLK